LHQLQAQTLSSISKMTELDFYPKYVAPFYMDLMNLNFLNKSTEDVEYLFSSLHSISKDLDDKKLIEMLNDSWRPSKVSAWIIGISSRKNLVNHIESFLCKKGIHYSEHALINLLILKGQESTELLKRFIKQQIEYLSETDNKLEVENLSIEWAVSILGYIDKINGTYELNEIYTSEKWLDFEKELKALTFYDSIKSSYEPTYCIDEITKLMQKIKEDNNS